MNKIIYSFVAFSGILVMANCSPKTVKTATIDNTRTDKEEVIEIAFGSKPFEEQMDIVRSMATEENINGGSKIYQFSCGKCHKLHSPDSRNIASWMKVMKSMSKKAKLSDQHYKLVSVYLNSKAKV